MVTFPALHMGSLKLRAVLRKTILPALSAFHAFLLGHILSLTIKLKMVAQRPNFGFEGYFLAILELKGLSSNFCSKKRVLKFFTLSLLAIF